MAERTEYLIDTGLDPFGGEAAARTADDGGREQPDPALREIGAWSLPEVSGMAVLDDNDTQTPTRPEPRLDAKMNTIYGTFGHDTLVGTDWAEVFVAYLGNDTILGYGGNDVIHSGMALGGQFEDADHVSAGGGDDIVFTYDDTDFVDAGSGNDWVFGGDDDDTLLGNSGDDVLNGEEGEDYVSGGAGHDWLFGGWDNDVLYGGDGDDVAFGGTGSDLIWGNDGDDIAFGEAGQDDIFGHAGNDVLLGGDGGDYIDGGADDDRIAGGSYRDTIMGGAGSDRLFGGHDPDSWGGEGLPPVDIYADLIEGGEGNDVILGDGGDDTLRGEAGQDSVFGGGGGDHLYGGVERDHLYGGTGDDVIEGGNGGDVIFGNGLETLSEPDGDLFDAWLHGTDPTDNDVLIGGHGPDLLFGGAGQDRLEGGGGGDFVVGSGNGDDLFGDNVPDPLDKGADIFVRGLTLAPGFPPTADFGGGSGFDYVHDFDPNDMAAGDGYFQQGADTHVTWQGETVLVLLNYDSNLVPVTLVDPAVISYALFEGP